MRGVILAYLARNLGEDIGIALGPYRLVGVRAVRQDDLRAVLGETPGVYVCNYPEPAWFEHFAIKQSANVPIERKGLMFSAMAPGSQWLSMTQETPRNRGTSRWVSPRGVIHLGLGWFGGRLGQLWQWAQLVRTLMKTRQTYTYCLMYNFDLPQFFAGVFAKFVLGKRLVVDYEDDYTLNGGSRLKRWFERRLRALPDAAVCINGHMQAYFPNIPTAVVNCFADLTYVKDVVFDLPDDAILLYSGRFDSIRGIDLIPDLVAALRARGKTFHIWITGTGPLRAMVESWSFPEVTYKGLVSEAELLRLTGAAHACLILQKPDHAFSRGSFPSKIENYARLRRPILALTVA